MPLALVEMPDSFKPTHLERGKEILPEIKKVMGEENGYPDMDSLFHRNFNPELPYKLHSEEGKYVCPSSDCRSFTACGVEKESLDLTRILDEVSIKARREYELYDKIIRPLPESYKMPTLIQLRLAEFRGDEKRFEGDEAEVRDNLFYWNFASYFGRRETLYTPEGTLESELPNGGADYKINWGKTLYEKVTNISLTPPNTWLFVFRER